MPTKHCCFGVCNSDSRYRDRDHMKGVFFIPFPKPSVCATTCAKWIHACSRIGFTVNNVRKSTYICSKHFVGGNGPTHENPDPIPANARAYQVHKLNKLKRRAPSLRKDDGSAIKIGRRSNVDVQATTTEGDAEELVAAKALLSLCVGGDPPMIETEQLGQNTHQENEFWSTAESSMHDDHQPISQSTQTETELTTSTCTTSTQTDLPVVYKETSTQTSIEVQDSSTTTTPDMALSYQVSKIKIDLFRARRKVAEETRNTSFGYTNCMEDEKKFKYYCGLSTQVFLVLWRFLGPAASCLKMWSGSKPSVTPRKTTKARFLKPMDQLFLTLVRLRSGLLFQDIAYRYNISRSLVERIFITWIQFLYISFKKIPMFPSYKDFPETVPTVFKKFKHLRLIIDCTEFSTNSPSDYRKKGNMYSSYKAHTTVKVLVGILPSGAIAFISKAFEGCISDREIVQQSGLLDKLERGDLILADRGFTIDDLLDPIGCSINYPPFLRKRKRLSQEEVRATKKIASTRIHVERAIGRIKEFRLLKRIIPLNLLPVVSQMIFVAGCLVNFDEPLVS